MNKVPKAPLQNAVPLGLPLPRSTIQGVVTAPKSAPAPAMPVHSQVMIFPHSTAPGQFLLPPQYVIPFPIPPVIAPPLPKVAPAYAHYPLLGAITMANAQQVQLPPVNVPKHPAQAPLQPPAIPINVAQALDPLQLATAAPKAPLPKQAPTAHVNNNFNVIPTAFGRRRLP